MKKLSKEAAEKILKSLNRIGKILQKEAEKPIEQVRAEMAPRIGALRKRYDGWPKGSSPDDIEIADRKEGNAMVKMSCQDREKALKLLRELREMIQEEINKPFEQWQKEMEPGLAELRIRYEGWPEGSSPDDIEIA